MTDDPGKEDSRDYLSVKALTVSLGRETPDPRVLVSAAGIIRQGGIVAYPTETTYGLGANPFIESAMERLFMLKGRPPGRAFILLVGHAEQAFELCHASGPDKARFDLLARHFWPGPLTLVMPTRPRLRCPGLAGSETVALRVSSHPLACQLTRTVGCAITSTSANLTGEPPALTADSIPVKLAARLDLLLDAGPAPGDPPSTLLDLSGSRPRVLRTGRITPDMIAKVLGRQPLEEVAEAS